jgi:hypothetical protein
MAANELFEAVAVDIDDPQRPYIDEAMARLCQCLKKDFTPYLAAILPPILYAAEKSDITITESMFAPSLLCILFPSRRQSR